MIKKAVITAAGYGTRFLPATKNVPKELLPVINVPTIKYVVDNCVCAGIEEIIIVTRYGNHAVEDFFDSVPNLEKYLIDNGKFQEAEEIKKIYTSANFIFVRQDPRLPYGNASPLYSARRLVDSEPFVYCWGDDVVIGDNVGVCESVHVFESSNVDVTLFTTKVDQNMISKLGMVIFSDESTNFVKEIIEKPKIEQIVSNFCSVSNYVFSPVIFEYLNPKNMSTKEFMIQPTINLLCQKGKVNAVKTKGKWFTTGDPLNYIKATVEIALQRNDLKDSFLDYLKSILKNF